MRMHLVQPVSHRLHKVHWHREFGPPTITYNTSLDAWPSVLAVQAYRFVEKVESCIAHTATRDEHGTALEKLHTHAFVRITLAPFEGEVGTVVLVERTIKDARHSVIPVVTTIPTADAGAVQDHACMIFDGVDSEFTDTPKVDRTIVFGGCKDRQLSLQELATVFQFVSQNGKYSAGEDCALHSLWFARTCVAALKEVMYGSFLRITPPIGEAAVKVDVACQDAIDLFISDTFNSGYPARVVAEKNKLRQLDALCGEERAKRKLEIDTWCKARQDRETVRKTMREIREARNGW